jgi:hypothetical protein
MELMQTLDDAWNARDVEVFRQRHNTGAGSLRKRSICSP